MNTNKFVVGNVTATVNNPYVIGVDLNNAGGLAWHGGYWTLDAASGYVVYHPGTDARAEWERDNPNKRYEQ